VPRWCLGRPDRRAPAARFARRLAELVKAAVGVDAVSWAGHESEAHGAG
jgi:hypothetical protein